MRTDDHGLISRAALLADGFTNTDIQRLCARGQLRRVTNGNYTSAEVHAAADESGRHRLAAIARLRAHSPETAVSHVSAAVVHNFDMWDTALDRVHLTRNGGKGARSSGLHVHTSSLHPDDVVERNGIRVTGVGRTIVDCGRILDLDHAVVLGDSALRKADVTGEQLRAAMARCSGFDGIGAARRAIARMNGGSESPGESLSRLRMQDAGMPDPVLQQVIRSTVTGFRARVDFYWKRWRIVGEFDGMFKYDRGESAAAEKLREDALRDLGFEVIRWTWKDLWHFDRVVDKFERARTRSEHRR